MHRPLSNAELGVSKPEKSTLVVDNGPRAANVGVGAPWWGGWPTLVLMLGGHRSWNRDPRAAEAALAPAMGDAPAALLLAIISCWNSGSHRVESGTSGGAMASAPAAMGVDPPTEALAVLTDVLVLSPLAEG